jgi:hypothetical protein
MLAPLVLDMRPTTVTAFRRPRGLARRLLVGLVATTALLGACTPAALAQLGSPLGPLQQQQSQTTSTQVVTAQSSSSSGSGIGATTDVALFVIAVALLLIAGIAWFILRDARSHQPSREGALAPPRPRRSTEQRERDRAAAKAARRARKQNR